MGHAAELRAGREGGLRGPALQSWLSQELIVLQLSQVTRHSPNRDCWAQLPGLGREDGIPPTPLTTAGPIGSAL